MDGEDLITMLLLLITLNGNNSKVENSEADKVTEKEYGIIL